MPDTSIDSDHVPWQELDSSVIKIDEKAAFQRNEALIRIRMTVPMVSLGHGAYTNFMIIDLGD